MHVVNDKSTIYALYLNDADENYNGQFTTVLDSNNTYVPIMDDLANRNGSSFKFVDPQHGLNRVTVIGGSRATSTTWDAGVKHQKAIDISYGNISLGSDKVILNFTSSPIVVTDATGYSNRYFPLTNGKLGHLANKILVVETHSINIGYFREKEEFGSVIRDLCHMLRKNNNNVSFDKLTRIYEEAYRMFTTWELDKNRVGNCIKVVSLLVISDEHIGRIEKDVGVEVPEYNFTITNSIEKITLPSAASLSNLSKDDLTEIVGEGTYLIYINDPDDKVGDRYSMFSKFNLKISKIRTRNEKEGLHIKRFVKGCVVEDEFCTLEEMDNSGYVFKTREEVETGFNKLEANKVNLEERRHEHEVKMLEGKIKSSEAQQILMELKNDREDLLRRLQEQDALREDERREEEYKRRRAEAEKQFENDIYKDLMEKRRDLMKFNQDYEINNLKARNEQFKSESDITLTKLKLILGFMGGMGVAYALAKKYEII